MNVKDVIKYLDKGIKPCIKFENKQLLDNLESIIDFNMVGKVVSYEEKTDYYILHVNLNPYLTYNKDWMVVNYYDKDGNPKFNCIESGAYKDGREELCVTPDNELGTWLGDDEDQYLDKDDGIKQMLEDAFYAGQESMTLEGIEQDDCAYITSHTSFNEWYDEYTKEKIK